MAYEYKEYPKWVKDKDGKDVIANNAEEEVKITKKKASFSGSEKDEKKSTEKDGW